MANRTFSKVQALNHEVKVISGSIKGAIASPSLRGLGFSAEKNGANNGEIKITLEDKYTSLLSATASAMIDADVAAAVKIKSHDVSGTKEIVLKLFVEDADPANSWAATDLGADEEVQFTLVLRNSSADKR
tara:strand:+ start:17898 stop:18290 length:393 start_codon:yes stop_codon:yes gene_type:complete